MNWFNDVDATYRIARIGLAEGRLARLTAALWISTLAVVAALIKL